MGRCLFMRKGNVHTDPGVFDVPITVSVNTAAIGTTWQFFIDKESVPSNGGFIILTAAHSGWDSGARYVHFSVTGATAVAEGGSSTSSPALNPTNRQAQFTINLSDITGDISLYIESVTG